MASRTEFLTVPDADDHEFGQVTIVFDRTQLELFMKNQDSAKEALSILHTFILEHEGRRDDA